MASVASFNPYWHIKFDGAGQPYDASSNNLGITVNGSPTPGPIAPNGSKSAYFSTGDSFQLDFATSAYSSYNGIVPADTFTLVAWIRPTQTTADFGTGQFDGATTPGIRWVWVGDNPHTEDTGAASFNLAFGTNGVYIAEHGYFNSSRRARFLGSYNNWTHVAAVIDINQTVQGADYTLFINGQQVVTGTQVDAKIHAPLGSGPYSTGNMTYAENSTPLEAWLGEMAVIPSALTDQNILDLYNERVPSTIWQTYVVTDVSTIEVELFPSLYKVEVDDQLGAQAGFMLHESKQRQPPILMNGPSGPWLLLAGWDYWSGVTEEYADGFDLSNKTAMTRGVLSYNSAPTTSHGLYPPIYVSPDRAISCVMVDYDTTHFVGYERSGSTITVSDLGTQSEWLRSNYDSMYRLSDTEIAQFELHYGTGTTYELRWRKLDWPISGSLTVGAWQTLQSYPGQAGSDTSRILHIVGEANGRLLVSFSDRIGTKIHHANILLSSMTVLGVTDTALTHQFPRMTADNGRQQLGSFSDGKLRGYHTSLESVEIDLTVNAPTITVGAVNITSQLTGYGTLVVNRVIKMSETRMLIVAHDDNDTFGADYYAQRVPIDFWELDPSTFTVGTKEEVLVYPASNTDQYPQPVMPIAIDPFGWRHWHYDTSIYSEVIYSIRNEGWNQSYTAETHTGWGILLFDGL